MTPHYVNADNNTTFKTIVYNDLHASFAGCATDATPPSPPHPTNDYLKFPNCYKVRADAVLAAFFVMSMLGQDPSQLFDAGGSMDDGITNNDHLQGINWAKDHYTGWASLVDEYNARGWVNYNAVRTYVCDTGANRASWNTRQYGRDAAWIPCTPGGGGAGDLYEMIVFHNPNNNAEYKIIKICGNAKGTLKLPSYKLSSNLSAGANTSDYIGLNENDPVEPGKKYTVKAQIANTNNAAEAVRGGQLRVRVTGDGRTWVNGETPSGALGVAKTEPSVSANYGFSQQYFANGDPAGSGNPANPSGYTYPGSIFPGSTYPTGGGASGCGVGAPGGDGAKRWCWKYARLNRDSSGVSHIRSIPQEFKFTVPANATVGQQFCLKSSVYTESPLNQSDVTGDSWCFIIGLPANPTYMQVFGNDVIAGGGFGDSCSPMNQGARIRTKAESEVIAGNTYWKGASSQFGAFALGPIDKFFSASMRQPNATTNLPRPPIDLSFGNLNTTTHPNKVNPVPPGSSGLNAWGGDSGVENCIPDYYDKHDVLQAGTQLGPYVVGRGSHQALYYDHDLYINGNIDFADVASNWGSSIDGIPSLYIVVKGNIYIGPNVTNLDGVFVAQPTGNTGGKIVTCANSSKVTPTTGCDQKLTINGSFIARQVQFKRTFGQVANANPGENPGASSAAEVFNFSPEVYLSPLHPTLSRSVPFSKYDYITSLPPVL
jgi:hypothetical protein